MLGALDVLLLPSLREGLPLVGIEAQAAGVPLLASAAVTDELDVVPGLVHRLSLAEPAEAWADAALACRPADRGEALARVRQSPFNIEVGLRALEEIYAGRGG
jgi:glycosyltransferase involved in cell wall biosynthesis